MRNNSNLNIDVYTNDMVKLCPFFLKILSGNEILTPINGGNSVTKDKMTRNNANPDFVNTY